MFLTPLQTALVESPEGLSLLRAVVESPWEHAPRLVLADWLEERGDARAALLRLVPALEATPRQQGPRADLPCRVWRDEPSGRPYTSGGQWPPLPHPVPPGREQRKGRRDRWRGLHHLGRLLSAAMLREVLQLFNLNDERTAPLLHLLARWEVHACGLIDACERDVGNRVTGPSCVVAWHTPLQHVPGQGVLCRAAWRCRAGPFSAYFSVAEELVVFRYISLLMHEPPPLDEDEVWLLERLRHRAVLYGRFLDLATTFARIVPWEEGCIAWENRGH
jgi:uncharacterized protein (TIGR02996 family)